MVAVADLDGARVGIFGVCVVPVDGAVTVTEPEQVGDNTPLARQIAECSTVVSLSVHRASFVTVAIKTASMDVIVTEHANPEEVGFDIPSASATKFSMMSGNSRAH